MRVSRREVLRWGMGAVVGEAMASRAPAQDSPEKRVAVPHARVRFVDEGKRDRVLTGQVLVEAQDGGILLQTADGRLWPVEKDQMQERQPLMEAFRPATAVELGKQLQGELGTGWDVVVTRHYVLCGNTHKGYLQWCGGLFERLFTAFQNYWKPRGIRLRVPEFPLMAIVFAEAKQFAAFATQDAGPETAAVPGYYSIPTNRVVFQDLTSAGGRGATSSAEIERRLALAPYQIATVIHEAVHQMAFNAGLHTRLADNPLWVTEGMAMYFEMPDLSSKSGWRTIGAVNTLRQRQLLDYLDKRYQRDALPGLIASDARFTDAATAGDAYAVAWSLTYFLIKTRGEEYVKYLQRLQQKPRLVWDKPAERVAEFEGVFGKELSGVEAEWLRFARRLRG